MRLPLSIALSLCFAVVIGIWSVRSSRFGNITPPSEEEISKKLTQFLPNTGPIQIVTPKHEPKKTASPSIELTEKKESPPEKATLKINTANAAIAPGLSEYAGNALKKDSEYLLLLGESLTKENFGERALLAYERVLDSSTSTAVQQDTAIEQIQHLRQFLPPWVCDSSETAELQLNILIPKNFLDLTEEPIKDIALKLTAAASGTVKITSKTIVNKEAENNDPNLISVFFSDPKDLNKKSEPHIAELQENFSPKEIYANIYLMIRNHLGRTTAFPRLLLSYAITRLVWRELPKTLLNNQEDY